MSKENDDFISFLEEKFDEYIHENRCLIKHRHFGEFGYHLGSSVDVYERVNIVTRAHNNRNGDVDNIFTHDYLKETVSRIDGHYSKTMTNCQ